jgi:hypothetical protein
VSEVPDSIKEVFEQLKSEITSLHARWKIYRQLFGHSDERIGLLNRCAPTFFFFIHGVLIDEIQLSIGKLTDRARTGKNENLSFKKLHEQIEELGDEVLSSTLSEILIDLCGEPNNPDKPGRCEVIRNRRHKRIAHFDLKTLIQPDTDPLPGVSRQMIEDVLALVRKYMNTIEGYYCQSEYRYHDPIIGPYDGEALVAVLEDGLEFRRLEIESVKKRYELSDEDLGDA